ncbi:MAG TPA: M20/M25/M40 family metallo-hydrolase [Miltoncostaeaceae bacterium]|nr:M20/M25/M40 family metallo-hydrolase [Miltoncostaeaceae bacterium]
MRADLADLGPAARLMVELCEIPSPSGDEAAVAAAVRERLERLGARVSEDDAAERIGAGCGNLLAAFPPTPGVSGTPILFAAHLDTVPVAGPIEVGLVDGHLVNRRDAILGADDKAAVAALLVALERVVGEGREHAGVELLFTPCEEVGLKGAAAFDIAPLRARMGCVFDHTGALGGIVRRAPSLHRIEATFVGRAAHAGIHPEDGRNAIAAAAAAIARMPLGRIDEHTTANVGEIRGGSAANVVAERCTLIGEARGHDEAALAAQLTAMLDAITWAATEHGLDVQTTVSREFTGYTLPDDHPPLALARRALAAPALPVRLITSGGGSDVNALIRNGFPAVNLCNAMLDVHTPAERIRPETLEELVEITLAIIAQAREAA